MAKRTARVAFAILAGSTLLTFLPRATIVMAEDCLTEPAGGTAEGQHWYYRFDRNSNRRCWYLKDKDTAPRLAQQPQGQQQPQQQQPWDFAQQPTPPRLAPRTASSRSNADTLADPSSPRLRVDDARAGARPIPVSAPTGIGKGPTAANPSNDRNGADASWPQPQTQFQLLNAATTDTEPAPAPTATPVADQADLGTGTSSAPPVIDAPESVSAKSVKPAASLHMLLLIVVGALAISGFMASAMYRLSKIGRRRRRNANWKTAIARARRARAKPHAKPKTNYIGPSGRDRVAKQQPAKVVAARVGNAAMPGEISVSKPASAAAELPGVREPHTARPVIKPDTAAAAQLSGPPAATTENVAQHAESIAELAELLEFRAAKSTGSVKQPAGSGAAPPIDHEAGHSNANRPDADNSKADNSKADRFKAAPAETARQAKPVDPVVELTQLLQSRAAKKAPKAAKQPTGTAAASTVEPQVKPRQLPDEVLATKATAPVAKLGDLSQFVGTTTKPTKIAASQNTDPAAELMGLLDTRFALPAAEPSPVAAARNAAKPAEAAEANMPPARKAVPGEAAADRAAPGTGAADRPAPRPKKAAQHPQERAAGARKAKRRPVAVADVPPPTIDDPAAALIDMLESQAAKPVGRVADASSPPLDFIPRPQALRPRTKSVRQDESLDGIQDILARLARHA